MDLTWSEYCQNVCSDCFKVKSFFILFQKVAVTASAFGAGGVFWVIDLNLISFHPVLIQHNYREYPPTRKTYQIGAWITGGQLFHGPSGRKLWPDVAKRSVIGQSDRGRDPDRSQKNKANYGRCTL